MICYGVSDGCMTYLTANTIQFTRSYLSFCEDLLKVYTANRHELITSAFIDILTAHVNCLHRAAVGDKFKHEVKTSPILNYECLAAGDISHKPSSRLPLLSIRHTVTFPARDHPFLAGTKLYCLVTEAHRQHEVTTTNYASIVAHLHL